VTSTFELDVDRGKVNQHSKYLDQRSFDLEVIVRTHTHTFHVNQRDQVLN